MTEEEAKEKFDKIYTDQTNKGGRSGNWRQWAMIEVWNMAIQAALEAGSSKNGSFVEPLKIKLKQRRTAK